MLNKRFTPGFFIILILVIIPVVLWAINKPLDARFINRAVTFTSLGQLAALSGTVLFAVNFVLSTRAHFLEPLFGGLNKVHVVHHLTGKLAFLLLLVHPIFLSIPIALFSIQDALLFFVPSTTDIPVMFGISALSLLTLLLILTLFVPLRYHVWKFTHQFMGIPLFLASVHIYLIPSDVATNTFLRWYMLGIVTIGLVSYTYRTLLGRFLVRRYLYLVDSVRSLNKHVLEIILKPKPDRLTYKPGQFAFVSFDNNNISTEVHPFSLTSNPEEKTISFGIKKLGDYTDKLNSLPPNTLATIEGPFGAFSFLNGKNKEQIWIAGGIGITPFISMLKDKRLNEYSIDLYYSIREMEDFVYRELITSHAKQNPNFRYHLHVSTKKGHLTAQKIARDMENILGKDIFICGPFAMIQSMKKKFLTLGAPEDQIHTEEFRLRD